MYTHKKVANVYRALGGVPALWKTKAITVTALR